MNFDKLTDFAITIVLAAALAGNLDSFTTWVYVARAKLFYESRTESWGSPDFFPYVKTNTSKLQRQSSHRH
ncbi:MAG: hypothetical protein H7235_02305 [Bdellovibrionaceae bacterium]|nr:hypothetical protein [Pseudobdellovibrionaceae bacterium]